MAVGITTTLHQIAAWPVQDQIEFLHQAWDRLLETGWAPELTDAQKQNSTGASPTWTRIRKTPSPWKNSSST